MATLSIKLYNIVSIIFLSHSYVALNKHILLKYYDKKNKLNIAY